MVALCAGALWLVFLYNNPYGGPLDEGAQLFGVLRVVAAALGVVTAVRGAHLGMYLVFFVSFVPVGFYLLLGPGVFHVIGWLDLAYLGSAMVVHLGRRRIDAERGEHLSA